MLMIVLWTIALIVDISNWEYAHYTGFDIVVRDVCIIELAVSLFALK